MYTALLHAGLHSLVAATGSVTVNGVPAPTRAGVAIADEAAIEIVASEEAELVLVEVS